jgi:hypothetical protein
MKVVFPSKKAFVKGILLSLVQKTLVEYAQSILAKCDLIICTFDLWMSKRVHDVFAMVVIFFLSD